VVLANGTYDIGSSLLLTRDNLVFTGDTIGGAVLRARPALRGAMLVVSDSADGWELSNLVFDGNRANRLYASSCAGYRGAYTNIQARGTYWTIANVQSNATLCGTALEVKGAYYVIRNSDFRNNGTHGGAASEPWADGVTLLTCDHGQVHDNHFLDNTDVDIVNGGGDACVIERNTIDHVAQYGYAGIMVGYFDEGFPGVHRTNHVRSNLVRSALNRLAFGTVVGLHPWVANVTVEGGTVQNNAMSGAVHNLAVDGISSGSVQGNTMSNSQGTQGFRCTQPLSFTAAHSGSATIQAGYVEYQHHYLACGTPQ
jgi:hypothetical protein